ncbi:hypothetical protein E2I00_014891 [Balaenoptera physalus]|uniref:GYF domain-containing protein n=1 Tax=Balaenoptera physalus TaxID=9770 RepID=A0A643CDB6_BALPH|nr:hypothetical protein E2I00_014891 [Balaenoptera physalus]
MPLAAAFVAMVAHHGPGLGVDSGLDTPSSTMAAETLNFGPEWLRALSSGGSVASPPPSPAMPKYKLADYRYGREEMLALYVKESKVPDELQDKEFAAVLQEEPLQPLALEPLTEEEQVGPCRRRRVSTVEGAGVGKAGGGVAVVGGVGAVGCLGPHSHPWLPPQRNFSLSVNSVAVLRLMGKGAGPPLGRGRGDSCFYQRSIEEGDGAFGRNPREIQRSQSWDDRRIVRVLQGPWPPSADCVFPCSQARSGFDEGGAGPRKEHARSDSENWRICEAARGRLFLEKGPKEPIPEEQELDFQGLEEEEEEPSEGLDEEGPEAGKPARWGKEHACSLERAGSAGSAEGGRCRHGGKELTPLPPQEEKSSSPPPLPSLGPLWGGNGEGDDAVEKDLPAAEGDDMRAVQLSPGVGSPPGPPGDLEDDEGLKHLQQEAEKLVASLQDSSLEEEQFTAAIQAQGLRHSAAATALPLSHGAARKWFYKDPQGEIQGPFTTQEMAEWFQAGYFSMALLVKRGCDEGFQPLGEVIKMWGRVPFAPGPSPPPLLGNMDQERLKKQQELAAAALYQQLQHQQFLQLGLSMKTLLELQLEGERQMHKQPPPREPSRAPAPNHRRPVRKKTEEEEKLLKLLQGIPRPQDGFTQWCEQMLHTLTILKEVESPYDVHDYIRSCLGDTLEAKEFAKQFLERRAKQKASQQRQQQQEAWLSSGSLQTAFQTNHSTKLGSGEGSKAKRRALMLHSDPSILGYSLHGPSGEIESVDDY